MVIAFCGALVFGFEFLHFAKQVCHNSFFLLCKILRTNLKTVGVHCFPGALVQIPTSCYNAKKASTFCASFFACERATKRCVKWGKNDQKYTIMFAFQIC